MFLKILLFCLVCSTSFAAELLVQAKDSPFSSGAKNGDIVAVRPDGWSWGSGEGSPDYAVVKLPQVSFNDAKQYEEPLLDGDREIRARRYYYQNSMVKVKDLEEEKALIEREEN